MAKQTSDTADYSNEKQNSISHSVEEQPSDNDDDSNHSEINKDQLNRSREDKVTTRKRLFDKGKTRSALKDGDINPPSIDCKPESRHVEKENIGSRRSIHQDSNYNNNTKQKCLSARLLIVLVLLLCGGLLVYWYLTISSSTYVSQTLKNYKKDIYDKYREQDKHRLRHFFETIELLKNSTKEEDKSAIVTLLYSHKETAECLANDLAKYTAQMLTNNQRFTHLNGSLMDKDFSLGCNNFKEKIIENRVLVVYNFHDIADDMVKHFHGICEKYPPYIKDEAVYIVLLELGFNQVQITHSMKKLMARMQELWPTLRDEILLPLVTRIGSDLIIDVKEKKQIF